jgi:small neutral amino acid transporter SnatA (MarC family)
MSKKSLFKPKIGWIISSIGVGVLITFIVPFWGWIIAGGCGLIYIGWCLIRNPYH